MIIFQKSRLPDVYKRQVYYLFTHYRPTANLSPHPLPRLSLIHISSNWPREGGRSNDWDYPNERAKEFSRYFERKAMPQVLELLRQYPNISILWFDTPGYCSPEQSQRMIDTVSYTHLCCGRRCRR